MGHQPAIFRRERQRPPGKVCFTGQPFQNDYLLEAFFFEDFLVAFLVAFFTGLLLDATFALAGAFLVTVFGWLDFEALDALAAFATLVAGFFPSAFADLGALAALGAFVTAAEFFLLDFVSPEVFLAAD
jgi:hypothetical protein